MRTKNDLPIPVDVHRKLTSDTTLLNIFRRMRPSCQDRYVRWIVDAKRPETRARRVHRLGDIILDYGKRHRML